MKLFLGVVDLPEPEGNTTYGVGKILEEKYGLFSKFYESHEDKIVKNLTESLVGALETTLMGQHVEDPFVAATDQIATLGVQGVPTKAALMGKSVRFKRKRGPRRPSFIDSGTLQTSFKSWVK